MTDNQTLPPPQGPEYARCFGCGHIEPEHRPGTGPCLVCACAAYRPVPAVPVSSPPPDQTADRAAVLLWAADALPKADLPFVPPMDRRRVANWLRRLAAEAQQPDTETRLKGRVVAVTKAPALLGTPDGEIAALAAETTPQPPVHKGGNADDCPA